MAANDVQIRILGRDLASAAFRSVDVAAQNTSRNVETLGRKFGFFNGMMRNAVGVAAGVAGYEGLSLGLQKTIGSAFDFARSLEVSQTGMAGILVSMAEIEGRSIEWGEALAISEGTIKRLNDEALRTAATSQELVRAYQAILAPGLAAGMDMKQIEELTVTGVNAVKSIGLQSYQVVQELRDLVAGGIQPASSTLATALGLKDSDIAAARASSEGLFKFLMDRLKGFEIASGQYAKTWRGLSEQIKEGVQRAGAMGMDPLFSAIRSEMADFAKYIVDVNSETKKVEINPELVANIRGAAENAVELGRGLKEAGRTASVVLVPAAQLLGGALSFVAKNAEAVTYSIGAWMILSRVSVIYTDIAAVTAGASTAQTILGRNVLAARVQLEQQAAVIVANAATQKAATLEQISSIRTLMMAESSRNKGIAAMMAGKTAYNAAAIKANADLVAAQAAADAGQIKLARSILASNRLLAEQGIIAAATGQKQAAASKTASVAAVSGTAIASGAVKGMLGTVWALVGGWVGVAVAIGLAIQALTDWEERNSGDKAKNNRQRLAMSTSGIWSEDIDQIWAGDPARMGALGKPRASQKEIDAARDEILKKQIEDLTNKFSPSNTKGAEKAYEEEQKLLDKIADMIARMNEKISSKTATAFETASLKLSDEIANMKRELDKNAIDFAKYGISVEGVYQKIIEYQRVMTGEIEKQRSRSLVALVAETGVSRGARTGDYQLQAESEYQALLVSLEKQREEKLKEVARSKGDKEALVAVENWYTEQIKVAAQKRADILRDGRLREFSEALSHNSAMVAAGRTSSAAVDEMNRRILQNKIQYLTEELARETENKERRIQLNRELTDAINQQNEILARNLKTAIPLALQEIANRQTNFKDLVVRSFDDLNNSTLSHLENMITGAQSFSAGYQGIFKDMTDNIIRMILRMWYYQKIMQPLQSIFGGMFGGGNAVGSSQLPVSPPSWSMFSPVPGLAGGGIGRGWTLVGEEGIELVNFTNPARVYSNRDSMGLLAGGQSIAPKVTINLANNTGTAARAQARSSFDSETKEFVISIVLDSLDSNEMGMGDAVRRVAAG